MFFQENTKPEHKSQLYAKVSYKTGVNYLKPTLCYLFPSAISLQDRISGKYSHIELFNLILISKALGATVQTFTIAGRINNVPSGLNTTTVKILDPAGEVIAAADLKGTLEKGDVTFFASFSGVTFTKAGRYLLKAEHNGKPLPDGKKFYIDARIE